VYLASADWMTRNLDKRVELMFPVERVEHKAKVLYTLRAMFRDTMKARWLGSNGVYLRREPPPGEPAFRVQQNLQEEAGRLASLARERAGVVFRPEERDRSKVPAGVGDSGGVDHGRPGNGPSGSLARTRESPRPRRR
jgi:hypothetical protein